MAKPTATTRLISDSIRDLRGWAELMERSSESAAWLAANTDGSVRARARERRALALELAGAFRAEMAMWERLQVEQPWRLDPRARRGVRSRDGTKAGSGGS